MAWLLGSVSGTPAEIEPLHGTRLAFMLTQVIDSTVRGFLYEAAGTAPGELLAAGATLVRAAHVRTAIPVAILDEDPRRDALWQTAARAAIDRMLAAPPINPWAPPVSRAASEVDL